MTRRFKDRYWVRQIKWYLYKKYRPHGRWHTQFAFERALRRLRPGDIVLDCGANAGHYAIAMAEKGATVHAFEPDPDTFTVLERNTAAYPTIHCHRLAVGPEAGKASLFRAPDYQKDPERFSLSSSVIADKINVSTEQAIDIEQIDLAAFVNALGRDVAITKIDIEGAEVALLETLISGNYLDRFGFVFVETHETKVPSLASRTAALRDAVQVRYKDRVFLDWD